jgi:hypothetical protein
VSHVFRSKPSLTACLPRALPEEIAVQGEVQASVREAVAALPQQEQLATVLFYGYRYSYTEVSACLKIPLMTVKKRLYSARQKLKVQLQAALHDASERASHAFDSEKGAEMGLARWWRWAIQWVKARQGAWQIRDSVG